MKFLCLGYPDRGFSPRPGLVAEYAALGEAMRAAYAMYGGGVARRGLIVDLLEGDLDVKHDTQARRAAVPLAV